MREFSIIDSAVSVEQLRLRLRDGELEQYGEAFIPEYVYEVIKSLASFWAMQVSFVLPLLRNTILILHSVDTSKMPKSF